MDAAQAVGVDAGVLARIAAFESGFNVDAAPIARDAERNRVRLFDGRMGISSAHGLGQFTDATWRDTVNRYGGAHGVAGAGQRGGRPVSLSHAGCEYSPMVIESVSKSMTSPLDRNGNPTFTEVSLSLASLTALDRQDWVRALSAGRRR